MFSRSITDDSRSIIGDSRSMLDDSRRIIDDPKLCFNGMYHKYITIVL
jgi:hypothetical protein